MKEFEIFQNKKYIKVYKEKQWFLDAEKDIHSPELYAVWNLKHYLLTKISLLNPYKSKFFIYTDSGAWRVKKFSNWPDENFIQNVSKKIGERILYSQVVSLYFKKNIIQGKRINSLDLHFIFGQYI